MVKTEDVIADIMNRPLSECVQKIDTKEEFCVSMILLSGIIEENPAEGTQRHDDMVHLCNMIGYFISVTNNGEVEIPLDIFCKLGILADDYDNDIEEEEIVSVA